MISSFIKILQDIKLELTGEQIADVLWLACQLPKPEQPEATETRAPEDDQKAQTEEKKDEPEVTTSEREEPGDKQAETPPGSRSEEDAKIYLPPSPNSTTQSIFGTSFRSPVATALPGALEAARALRPLMRRVPSRTRLVLDEAATVQRIAEEGLWMPVMRPAPARWLEVAFVIDDGSSMLIWRQTASELRLLLERHGAFRDIRTWGLITDAEDKVVKIRVWTEQGGGQARTRSPRELVDPSGRRLILVLSDCISPAWRNGAMAKELEAWGRNGPVAIIQVLPQRLWHRSGLGHTTARLRALAPGVPNILLKSEVKPQRPGNRTPRGLPVPVVNLEAKSLAGWAYLVAGAGGASTIGTLIQSGPAADEKDVSAQGEDNSKDDKHRKAATPTEQTASQIVNRFRSIASPAARELAGYMAAAPLSLPVMRIVQQAMMPESHQTDLAEFFLGGLLNQLTPDSAVTHPDDIQFDFPNGVRELLLNTISMYDAVEVLRHVSEFIESHFGRGLSFSALLASPDSKEELKVSEGSKPFASVAANVLRRIGGDYAQAAERLEKALPSPEPVDPVIVEDLNPHEGITDVGPGPDISIQTPTPPIIKDYWFTALIDSINERQCVAIIGSEMRAPTFNDLAAEILAREYNYPKYTSEDRADLAEVAQFLALTYDPVFPKRKLTELIRQNTLPVFEELHATYEMLANLPLSVYLTTGYDSYLETALNKAGKSPVSESCNWKNHRQNARSDLERLSMFTPDMPLVYHLHGHINDPESMVLTEDDHIEFLSNLSRYQEMIPTQIRRALLTNSLLLMGFDLESWGIRALLRRLIGPQTRRLRTHDSAIQMMPLREVREGGEERVRRYAEEYFVNLRLHTYWGSANDFASMLQREV